MKQLSIASKDNPKIKFLKDLGQKKYRDELGKFIVENAVIISDALKANIIFETLFATEEFIGKNKEKFNSILECSEAKEYYLVSEKINKSFSSLETASGIAAIYLKPKSKINCAKPVVYLNAINDPGNLGTILRSALAFGIRNIVVDEKCADIYNHKTINAAKDAIFKLNIGFDKDLKILREIKEKMPIFSTRLEKSDNIGILENKKLFCIVMGSESHGVEKKIQELSDGFIRLEMSGEIESLNVASAAAIIFYEIYRRAYQASR